MKKLLIPILSLVSMGTLFAEVEPVTFLTGRGDSAPDGVPSSYQIPAGKTFILESVQFRPGPGFEPTLLRVQVSEKAMNFATRRNVFFDVGPWAQFKFSKLEPAARINGGSFLSSNSINGYYIWRGLLVDNSDLFATLDVELKDSKVDAAKLMATAEVKSSRPYRLKVESSTDLVNFQPDASATVEETAVKEENLVAINTGGALKKFLRVIAEARPRS